MTDSEYRGFSPTQMTAKDHRAYAEECLRMIGPVAKVMNRDGSSPSDATLAQIASVHLEMARFKILYGGG